MNRIKQLFSRRRIYGDLAEEIQLHLDERAEELAAGGLSREEAAAAARREFGNVTLIEERGREVWRWPFIEDLLMDIRYGVRLLGRSPVVTAVAVCSLALAVGANTAIFSIADSLMLRQLPVREPDRLFLIESDWPLWSYSVWEQIRERPQLFDGSFAWQPHRMNLTANGQRESVQGIFASGRFFEVLGVPAMAGRTITEADNERGGGPDGPVVVISYSFWQSRFRGAADVVGRSVNLERLPFTVVGITPPGFFGPDVGRTFDVVVPMGTEPLVLGGESLVDRPWIIWLSLMVRLQPGQDHDAATAALRAVQPQIREATLPSSLDGERRSDYMREPWTLQPAATGRSTLRTLYRQPLAIIAVVVALVLAVACTNIANLLLARATARRHELGVRRALGASRLRLARQFLVESLVLSAMGAALGLIFARWSSGLLVSQFSTTAYLDLPLDWRVLGFSGAATVLTALLFGTAPAFRASRAEATEALKEDGRSLLGRRHARVADALVIAQVTLSLALVVAAGLFVGTFSALATRNVGFDRDPLLVVDVDANNAAVQPAESPEVVERMLQAAAAVPGVARAAASTVTPLGGDVSIRRIDVPGRPSIPDGERWVYANFVSPDWFATYGTRLLAGREFTDRDGADLPAVAIVNEAFARRFLGDGSPLGQLIRQGNPSYGELMEVVGLVEDVVYRSLRDSAAPIVYLPLTMTDAYRHDPPLHMKIHVRAASGSPAMLTKSVADAVTGIDPDFALTFHSLADRADAGLAQERLLAILSSFVGALGLLLAGVGLYGVVAYAVSRRRGEIGVRLTLGAAPGSVVGMVLRHVSVLVGTGVVIGGALSLWVTRFAESLLFGLEPRDPVTFAAATVVLASVALLAALLPARRAARIDPMTVLRES